MTRKEAMDLMLSRVEEDKKEAFIEAIRGAKTKEERLEVARQYGAALTKAEAEAFRARGNAVSDEELDEAAGGCNCYCECTGV